MSHLFYVLPGLKRYYEDIMYIVRHYKVRRQKGGSQMRLRTVRPRSSIGVNSPGRFFLVCFSPLATVVPFLSWSDLCLLDLPDLPDLPDFPEPADLPPSAAAASVTASSSGTSNPRKSKLPCVVSSSLIAPLSDAGRYRWCSRHNIRHYCKTGAGPKRPAPVNYVTSNHICR